MKNNPQLKAAIELQRQASLPDVSAFVPANAGAGKTHVLVARIVRLLLRDVQPERILCLTYTRAAAAEMSDRLFTKLSSWIAKSDNVLIDLIHNDIGEVDFKPERLDHARRLFTRALETPGGLKVQTIHAFCERLLQRFPIEAGVVPGFHVLSDTDSHDMMLLARAQVLTRNDAAIRTAIQELTPFANEQTLSDLLDGLKTRNRSLLEHYGVENGLNRLRGDLEHLFNLADSDTPQTISETFARQIDRHALQSARTLMSADTGKANKGQAQLLSNLLSASNADDILKIATELTFNAGGSCKAARNLVAGNLQKNQPDCLDTLERLQDQVKNVQYLMNALTIRDATLALVYVGLEVIKTFNQFKSNRSAYDFSDLIDRTVALLRDRPDAAWVLYKLDGGLDHVLIDEAQDTSPQQWQIINALTEEFFAGLGARENMSRSMFAVGDRKQSIFSFQGADPRHFDEQADFYQHQTKSAGGSYADVELDYSFRSSEFVLRAVDLVFQNTETQKGVVSSRQKDVKHRPIRVGEKGWVEIWDLDQGVADGEVEHWKPRTVEIDDPPHRRMARRMAQTIKTWIEDGSTEELAPGQRIEPSDILILVRERSFLMAAIVEALKNAGVPVAGADRLKLLDHVAVQDLMALGQFCILPGDDLSLAGVLKSPLFTRDDGVSRFTDDDDLFPMAYGRKDTLLLHRLGDAVDAGKPYQKAYELLRRWRNLATQTGVFDFYSTVLSRDGGRRALMGGLGPEAADPVDAFLNLCLDYERDHSPSLPGFLAWLQATQADIKRDMDQSGGEVRVMTVHGAKGLEAPIVFLPDTCTVPKNRSAKIVYTSEGVPVWTLKKKYSNPQVSNLQSDARELALEEYNRLLYVAMTRARYRLYVCGFMKKAEAEAPKDSWYAKILTALAGSDPKFLDEVVVDGLKRWCGGERTVPQTDRRSGDVAVTPAPPPAWTGAQARPVQQPVRWLAPSRLLAAGETDTGWSREVALSPLKPRVDSRFRRGQLVHRLLQTLPEMPMDQRDDAARRYLKVNGVPSEEAEATINEIKALFHDASFADVFSAASRAEVSIAAFLPRNDGQGFGLSGQIDRLLVLPDRVVVVDFKTNRPPPDDVAQVPEIYLRQLAAYSHALQRVYPGRKVECALLWTDVPRLMPIPQFMLDQAWASATITMA